MMTVAGCSTECFLDLFPGFGVGPPGVRPLCSSESVEEHILQAGVERLKLHHFAIRPGLDGTRMFAEDYFDAPDGGRGAVSPRKLGGDDVERIDRAVQPAHRWQAPAGQPYPSPPP